MVNIQKHDFVEINYTGKLEDGKVFDTTLENIARKNNLPSEGLQFRAPIICIGESQLLPGLDQELVEKEVGKNYSITLPPERAFGKRDIKKVKIVPASIFKEHKVQPQPGLQVDVDGERGLVTSISSGRIIVNFNHPLAGKTVIYDLKVERKIADTPEKIKSFLAVVLRIPLDQIEVKMTVEKAEVFLPMEFPAQITQLLTPKLIALTGTKDILFKKS